MTLLLAPDRVQLFGAEGTDAHGWVLPHADALWDGPGNLQLLPGTSDPDAGAGGGHGPFAPGHTTVGTLFLPLDAQPCEGMAAVVRGRALVLSQVRQVVDPLAGAPGALSCWAATVMSTDTWSGDD